MSALPFDGSAPARDAALAALQRDGFALLAPSVPWLRAESVALDPWRAVEGLAGAPARHLERQPLRPVPGARSFAAGKGPAPLHTDSQPLDGVPAHLQVMACQRDAPEGGESLLLDGFALCERLAQGAPSLFARLVQEPRELRFYFGVFRTTTLARAGAELFLTHPPRAEDPLARALEPYLAAPLRLRVREGEVLLVDNHRMLHGRTAFSDERRHFERVLAWLELPLCREHPLRARLALAPPTRRALEKEEAAVLALLRGVPPGVVSARFQLDEEALYALRQAALEGLREGLARKPRR